MKPIRIAAVALASSLVGAVGVTAANATFDDVSESSQFAESITNVQEAGIATGYNDGTFRPRNALQRQQAAAWIDRASTRSTLDFADESGEHAPVNPNDPTRELATIEMSSPSVGDGGGWVTLDGYVAAATQAADGTGCPCAFDVRVVNGDGDDVAIGAMTAPGPAMDDERPVGPVGIAPVQGIVWLPAGETETYTLEITLVDGDVGNVFVAGTLSGQYTPMADGDPTVHGESSSTAGDPVSLVPAG